jgi:hypothetical protein
MFVVLARFIGHLQGVTCGDIVSWNIAAACDYLKMVNKSGRNMLEVKLQAKAVLCGRLVLILSEDFSVFSVRSNAETLQIKRVPLRKRLTFFFWRLNFKIFIFLVMYLLVCLPVRSFSWFPKYRQPTCTQHAQFGNGYQSHVAWQLIHADHNWMLTVSVMLPNKSGIHKSCKKSSSHFKILRARSATCSTFRAEGRQILGANQQNLFYQTI